MASHKWFACDRHRAIFKSTNQLALAKHSGCGRSIRPVGNEPFWQVFLHPELFLDWLRLSWEDLCAWLRSR